MHEDSEVLLRIFKLFNLFYEKFSQPQVEEAKVEEDAPQSQVIVTQIQEFYGSKKVTEFVAVMNDMLKIISNANIDISDSISNLIFCVFASFFPEVYQ